VSWTGAGPLALAAALLAAGCRAHQGGPGARLPAPPAAAGEWHDFTTPDGGARIRFPAPPPPPDESLPGRLLYAVYNLSGSYLLEVFSRREGQGPMPPQTCRDMSRRGARGAVVEEKPIQLAGRDGIECRFLSTAHEPPHPLVMRALRVGDREYVVSASPRRGEGLPADAAAFLDSFEILEGSR
jgi:hypothetical protein